MSNRAYQHPYLGRIMVQYTLNRMKQGIENMNLKPRQSQFVEACVSAGLTTPVSRDELASVCDSTGIYVCPPSWITQDTTRRAGRGLYDIPELSSPHQNYSELGERPQVHQPFQ